MINILDKNLINMIAAGEVIERPASVVKELIENAIDAHATNIIIRIESGGMQSISIEDNGDGIQRDDIDKLFINHATSKIQTIDDISSLDSFGFRGEALASIASVSDTTIRTRYKNDLEGSEVHDKKISTIAMNQGTIVSVKNLFSQIPARRKFMKSDRTESGYIVQMITAIALANPEIGFSLIKDGKAVFHYHIVSQELRIKEIMKTVLLPFETIYASDDIVVRVALEGPGSLTSYGQQYLFVNKRPILSPIMTKAIKEAYTSYIKSNMKPSYVVFMAINPLLIDVNVHPRKTEVRFLDQRSIYTYLYKGIGAYFERASSKFFLAEKVYTANSPLIDENFPQKDKESYAKDAARIYNKNHSIQTRGEEEGYVLLDIPHMIEENISPFSNIQFLQIDKKFIVFSYEEELKIIDQHAASERIWYERYIEEYAKKDFDMQVALFPETIELSYVDYALALDTASIFLSFGIQIEDMGSNMIAIAKFHSRFPQEKITEIFYDMLHAMQEGKGKITRFDEKVIASLACRSAIMFGDELSQVEMRTLVTQLYTCKISFTCAHGRPSLISFSFSELLRKLGRC